MQDDLETYVHIHRWGLTNPLRRDIHSTSYWKGPGSVRFCYRTFRCSVYPIPHPIFCSAIGRRLLLHGPKGVLTTFTHDTSGLLVTANRPHFSGGSSMLALLQHRNSQAKPLGRVTTPLGVLKQRGSSPLNQTPSLGA